MEWNGIIDGMPNIFFTQNFGQCISFLCSDGILMVNMSAIPIGSAGCFGWWNDGMWLQSAIFRTGIRTLV